MLMTCSSRTIALLVACVFDQDTTHGLGGGDEMAPAFPVGSFFAADQAQVGLVDRGGRLQRLPRGLVGQLPGGELAQLVVDERQELAGGARVAGPVAPGILS
jgi:hypothetical protein